MKRASGICGTVTKDLTFKLLDSLKERRKRAGLKEKVIEIMAENFLISKTKTNTQKQKQKNP